MQKNLIKNNEEESFARYLSIDLDTKHSLFKTNFYSLVKKFLLSNKFEWLKDSNYKINNKLTLTETRLLERKLIKTIPKVAATIKKFDWTIILLEQALHAGSRMKKQADKILQMQNKKETKLEQSMEMSL
jgi:hypothetical protein